jgi:hypothetical protein
MLLSQQTLRIVSVVIAVITIVGMIAFLLVPLFS